MNLIKKKRDDNTETIGRNPLKKFWLWVKRLGFVGFLFFLAKGLLWLLIPYLVAMGLF